LIDAETGASYAGYEHAAGRAFTKVARMFAANPAFDLAVLLALPLLVILANDSWTFLQPIGTIDPWLYTGHFLDLALYLRIFPNTYYGSRFPWILFGAGIHSIFAPEAATLVLRLMLFLGGTIALYVTVRALWHNRAAALIAAITLGAHTQFLQAIGWDYPDGPAIVCLLAAAAFLALALNARFWKAWLFCAGIALVTAPSVQIFVLPFAGILLMGFLVNNLKRGRDWVECLLWPTTGALFGFSFYGVIYRHFTGDFFYPRAQWDASKLVSADGIRAPVADWLPSSGYLIFPFFMCVVALVTMGAATTRAVRSWRDLPDGLFFAASAGLQLALCAAFYVFFDLTRGATLEFDYYVSYLIAPAFVVLGGVLSLCLEHASERAKLALIPAFLLIVFVPFQFGALRFLPDCHENCVSSGQTLLLAVLSLAALSCAFVWLQFKSGPAAGRIAPLLAVAALVPLSLINVRVSHRIFFGDITMLRRQSSLVIKADAIIRTHDPNGQLRYWYNTTDRYPGVYTAISSLHLYSYRLVAEDLPKRTSAATSLPYPLTPGLEIVILSTDPDAAARTNATLTDLRLRLDVFDTRTVSEGPDSFTLTFVRVVQV